MTTIEKMMQTLQTMKGDGLPFPIYKRTASILLSMPDNWDGSTPAFARIRASATQKERARFRYDVIESGTPLFCDTGHEVQDATRFRNNLQSCLMQGFIPVEDSQADQCIHWTKEDNGLQRAYHDYHVHFMRSCVFTSFWEVVGTDGHSLDYRQDEYAFIHWIETVFSAIHFQTFGTFPPQRDCLSEQEERKVLTAYNLIYGEE